MARHGEQGAHARQHRGESALGVHGRPNRPAAATKAGAGTPLSPLTAIAAAATAARPATQRPRQWKPTTRQPGRLGQPVADGPRPALAVAVVPTRGGRPPSRCGQGHPPPGPRGGCHASKKTAGAESGRACVRGQRRSGLLSYGHGWRTAPTNSHRAHRPPPRPKSHGGSTSRSGSRRSPPRTRLHSAGDHRAYGCRPCPGPSSGGSRHTIVSGRATGAAVREGGGRWQCGSSPVGEARHQQWRQHGCHTTFGGTAARG